MANRRMIHRNVSVCEQLADCSILARLLYTWGLPHSSDWGVLPGSPRRLKAQVLPMSPETVGEIASAIEELVAAGLWQRFTHEGADYLCYPTFDKYQDIHNRTSNPRDGMPLPPNNGDTKQLPATSRDFPEVTEASRESPTDAATSGDTRPKRTKEKRTEEKRKRPRAQAHATAPPAHSEQERTDGERLRLPAATEALLSVFPDWKPAQVTEWISGAIRSVQSVAGQMVGLTDEMLATEIRRVPPVISKPGVWYVDKLIERLQRTPAARSGAPPEFIALEGECPEEEGGMQIWHYKLEKWLAQREQSAAG